MLIEEPRSRCLEICQVPERRAAAEEGARLPGDSFDLEPPDSRRLWLDHDQPGGPFPHPSRPSPPNAFSPEFLADARDRDESPTAAEAEYAGPWKVEPLPGHPGAVAVLRECESLEAGDEPEAVFVEEEDGIVCAAVLPGVEREPLFHLEEDADLAGLLPGGDPVVAVYGEQGPRVRGWLRRYHPAIVKALHTAESLTRNPRGPRPVARSGWGRGAGADRTGVGGAEALT